MSTPVAAPSRRAKLTPPTAPAAPAEIKLTEEQKKAKNAARMRQIRKGFDTAVATQQAQAFVLYGTALPEFNGAPAAPAAAPAKPAKAPRAPVAAAPVVTAVAKPARAKKVAAPVPAPAPAAPAKPAKAPRAPKAVVPAPAVAPAAPARAKKVAAVAKASADTRFVVTDLSTLKLYHAASAAELTKIIAGL